MSAMAALEASIDFPDEADIPGEVDISALEPIADLASELEAALGDAGRLNAVREGFRVAILGPPNAGKSSLMNRLARREAAIVSPIAGLHDISPIVESLWVTSAVLAPNRAAAAAASAPACPPPMTITSNVSECAVMRRLPVD